MLENIVVKGTTICDCGRNFIIQDINGLKRVNNDSFYGGVVKHYSETKCPKCGKEVILLLKQVGQTYEVINIAETPNKNVSKVIKIDYENVENVENKATIESEKESNLSNGLICPVCKKELKTKSGYTNHLKTHQK